MKIESIVANLKNLPPAPRVMPRLLALLADENTSNDEIVELLELDAGLTAKIIGVSNSVFYGGNGRIADIGQAVNMLGFNEIYQIVTNIYAKGFVGKSMNSYQMQAEERWSNSVATGIVMELMTRRFQQGDPATAYTIGLLHDVGKTAIDLLHEKGYGEVLARIEAEDMTLREAEKEVFGYDHAELGAALLKSWEFPDTIVKAIEFQFDPNRCDEYRSVASMLHLSRWICAGIAGSPGTYAWAFRFDDSVFATLGCAESDAMELMLASKDELQHKEELLKV